MGRFAPESESIMPDLNIFGAYSYEDLPSVAVADLTEEKTLAAIQAFYAAENAFMQEMLRTLCTFGTAPQAEFEMGGGGAFQRLSDVGAIEATKVGDAWSLGFPIHAYGDRTIWTQSYLDEATLYTLNRDAIDKAQKDVTTMINIVNSALLLKTNYTFNDANWPGSKTGSLNVRRLANNDSTDGSIYYNGSEIQIGSLQHYITSGSGTLAEAAFTAARAKLRTVGMDTRIVYLVSKATADTTEGLAAFEPVQDTRIVDPAASYALVSSPRARGRIASGEVWEWPHFPDGYIFAFDITKTKPVRIREHALAKYRGLTVVQDDRMGEIPSRPMVNKYVRRVAGAGIYNRVNGVCVQVSANADYTDPTLAVL